MEIVETITLTDDDLEQLKEQKVIYADGDCIKGTIKLVLVKE